MVLLEIERQALVDVVEADMAEWKSTFDHLLDAANKAASRHDTDWVIGTYDDELVYLFTVSPCEEVLPRRVWRLDLRFLDPDLEKKRARYDALARAFFDKYSWGMEG